MISPWCVLPENQRERLEQLRRAIPRQQIRPFVERRLESLAISRSERAVGAVGGHDQVRIDQLGRVVDSTIELEADTDLAAMTMQRAQEIDPGHAMEGVASEGYVLALVHDLHVVEDDLPRRDGIVDLGGDVADECERDVGEHEPPAVGGALRVPLVDAYVVARFGASHQVGEEEPSRPSTDDSNLHGFARPSLNWETFRRIWP